MVKTDEKFKMVAKTFKGLEEVLYKELKGIGATSIKKGIRMVEFEGDKEMMYRANFYLRTALRILKPIAEFKAQDEDELYQAVKKTDWSIFFDVKSTFAIDSVVNSKYFSHSKYVALKVKDAIVDQFRDKFGKRPYVETDDPDIRLSVHITNDLCTISLDSSGESLHKRGYRIKATKAPLNEVLAAGMILLTGWDGKSTFIDPMCGSGTILIEAAMIAHKIPPGIYRKRFGFENWNDFDDGLLQTIYDEDSQDEHVNTTILGYDVSEVAIRIAEENCKNAGLHRMISLQVKDFEQLVPENTPQGVVVTNPPYGERLVKDEIEVFYKMMGDQFKNNFPNFNVWLLSSNMQAIKNIGLHPDHKLTLYNGPLECKFLKYSIYQGSKKGKNSKM